jgi:hypothetical protein
MTSPLCLNFKHFYEKNSYKAKSSSGQYRIQLHLCKIFTREKLGCIQYAINSIQTSIWRQFTGIKHVEVLY